jgi:isopropylmalate/homocitrate/citramalate synthase
MLNRFQKFLNNPQNKSFYNKLGPPKLFDVSLRDGLQTFKSENDLKKFNLEYKKRLYNEIYFEHFPANIEVGSLVSKKTLPILADSMEFLQYLEERNKQEMDNVFIDIDINKTNNFILIPNVKHLYTILDKPFVKNISFITSVSNSFQKKNTRMDLNQSKNELSKMIEILDENEKNNTYAIDYFIKLYVSCINECPIEGKLDNDQVVHEILKLNNMNIDTICLSDTCGTLEVEDFEYIVDTCNFFGIPFSKMSLHLHVKNDRKQIVKEIIYKALDRKIIQFDVSLLESGGCSVTMEASQLANNLSYDLYYDTIIDYVGKKTNT